MYLSIYLLLIIDISSASLKSGFGHMEGCAGLVSIIKTTLVLERGIIPPVAGLETLNPDIDAEFLNLRVSIQHQP